MPKPIRPKKSSKTLGRSTIAKQPEALRHAAASFRRLADNLERKVLPPDTPADCSEQEKLARAMAQYETEGGRLLLEAYEAGASALAKDRLFIDLLAWYEEKVEKLKADGSPPVEYWQQMLFLSYTQQQPDLWKLRCSLYGLYPNKSKDEWKGQAAAMRRLADLIEADAEPNKDSKSMADSPGMLELAIAELLRRIPDIWQTYRPDNLTETQSQAIFLLIGAGMVERRCHGRLRMLNHPVMIEYTFTATGEYGVADALEKVSAAMWADWQEAYNKWKQGDTGHVSPFHAEQLEPFEWRLTDQGILARNDLGGDRAARGRVLDFVLKRGFFDGQPRMMPGGRITQHKPVRGAGALVSMEKVKIDADVKGMVNVGNWSEGADAFAKAFEGMLSKAAQTVQSPTAPTPPQADTAASPPKTKECEHSADFTSVTWYGRQYQFNKSQGNSVAALWLEWEKGKGLGLNEKTIGETVAPDTLNFRLQHVFRAYKKRGKKRAGAMHEAWGVMIVKSGRGHYSLAQPKNSRITE